MVMTAVMTFTMVVGMRSAVVKLATPMVSVLGWAASVVGSAGRRGLW
jgi:hypothetical protein